MRCLLDSFVLIHFSSWSYCCLFCDAFSYINAWAAFGFHSRHLRHCAFWRAAQRERATWQIRRGWRGWNAVRGGEWFGNALPPFSLLFLLFHSGDQWSGRWIKRAGALFIHLLLSLSLSLCVSHPFCLCLTSTPHSFFCSAAVCHTSQTKSKKGNANGSQVLCVCVCVLEIRGTTTGKDKGWMFLFLSY